MAEQNKQEIIENAISAIRATYDEDVEMAHKRMEGILLDTLCKLGAGAVATAYKEYLDFLYKA